jgi:Flp pilus assembly protein CpaB
MRSRGLVVAIAIVLAVAAAVGIIVYTNQVKDEATTQDTVEVIVSTEDIPASTPLQPLIDRGGVFVPLRVPQDGLVEGAVTAVADLEGRVTSEPILRNEQIPLSRLDSGQSNRLSIEEDTAVTVEFDAPQGGAGNIQRGDLVSVFATYNDVQAITGDLKQLINTTGPLPTGVGDTVDLPDFTVTLIPTVRVINIQNPEVDAETGRVDSSTITVTLDLKREDAQNLVFAEENAKIWLGLLPPDKPGERVPAAQVPIELLLGKKGA